MIPFEDLVAALDSWRARNGLPVGTSDVQASPRPAAAPIAYAAPAAYAPPPAARPVSPVAIPSTESDVLSIDDAEVEDDMYENEGNDFAMSFDGGQPPAAAPAPAPAPAAYADEDQSYEMEPAPSVGDGTYDDPAYDEPQQVEAAPAVEEAPPAEEEELDDDAAWAKLYPGAAATEDVPEEATVVGSRPDDDDV